MLLWLALGKDVRRAGGGYGRGGTGVDRSPQELSRVAHAHPPRHGP